VLATSNGSGSRTLTLTGSNAGNNSLASQVVNDAGGGTTLVKAGAGTWVLPAANAHSGGTQIDAGTLDLQNNTAVGSGAFTINGGTIQSTTGSRSLANAVQIGGDFSAGSTNSITLNSGGVGGINLLAGTRTVTVTNRR